MNVTPAYCDMCNREYKRAQPFDGAPPIWGSSLRLSGGYAEFWDSLPSDPEPGAFDLILCHDCTLPIFRKIMESSKYSFLKMEYFQVSHENQNPSDEDKCCEYSYNPSDYFS